MSNTNTLLGEAQVERFFECAKHRLELAAAENRRLASEFNVFDLIRPDEKKLSEVLALMLDVQGVHGQGDRFLQLLMEQLGTGLHNRRQTYATARVEAPTFRIERSGRRMDVFVDAGDLVAIENKLYAPEQGDQVKDYLEHLDCCAQVANVGTTLIYLTIDGSFPMSIPEVRVNREIANKRLRCWKYGSELLHWLETCQKACEAPRFGDFLNDFIGYIRTYYGGKYHNQPQVITDERQTD